MWHGKIFHGKCYLVVVWHSSTYKIVKVIPFAPGDFAGKTRFEGTRVVFWPLPCYKELKLTTNRFTGRTLHGLLIQMQNISLRSSGMRRKQNFETQQSWLLLFAFSSPLFFRFSCLIFFFRSISHVFLLLSPVSLTELCSFWYGLKDLFTLHKLADKVVLDR